MAKRRIAAEEFITLWQKAATLADFCVVTGYPAKTASVRASWFRQEGIPLKHMDRHDRRRLDRVALARLAERALSPA